MLKYLCSLLFAVAPLLFTPAWSAQNACAGDDTFRGRWVSVDVGPSLNIGVTQSGDVVTVISKSGWLVAEIQQDSSGTVAAGRGQWSVIKTESSRPVTAKMATAGGRLPIQITADDPNAVPRSQKLTFQLALPRLANLRI